MLFGNPQANMENVPVPKLQIVINKMQVSIRELPASNGNPYGILYKAELRHFHEVLQSKFNEPLTFTSNILMHGVDWQDFSPPAEILSGIGDFNGSKWGMPKVSTIITRSISEAVSRKTLGLLEAASQSNESTSISAPGKSPQVSSSSNVTVAGPSSRPKPPTVATDKDTSSIEGKRPSRVNSQLSTETSTTSESGYISAVDRSHSESGSRLSRRGYSKFAPLARFVKMLKKRQDKGKSVVAEPIRECVSCLDDFPVSDMVHVQCHDYCKDCFERLVVTAIEIESMWPVKCCLNDIPHTVILKNIKPDLAKTFQLKVSEREIAAGDRIYCVKPRGPWHEKMECPQDKDFQATVRLVLNLQLRQEAATRETQLQEIITRQEEERIRREAVRIRKVAEEERIAIQMVEDFERREAEEVGGEAERVFQLEEAILRRRDDTRIAEIASNFIEIREELNVLHRSQKSRLATRSQEEFKMLQEREDGFYKLLRRHSSQHDQLKKEYETEYTNQELRFRNEYDQRRKEEIRAVQENTEKLEAFWKDKPDAVYNIGAAKDSHKEGYILAFRNWDYNRKIALHECTKNFESRRTSLTSSQILEDAEFKQKMRDEWREWARNKVAEVRWFDAVIAEREHVLQTLENEQYTMATAESERGRAF
ncbi:hypothetical protein BPOR_0194g00090 [Botrytis porri]|uniref:RING-type domain-containing protein n=1 Tax=Botrytis porri TaxID=87229 RepID=A0A4Z1KTV2_9HELO|nr:hypothetical protein BPOR_0194g00090 [Botrytis porri]